MAGNTLGPRGKFLYIADGGVNYSLTLDGDIGAAGNLSSINEQNQSGAQRKPTRFKPRVVFCEATITTGEGEDASSYVARKEIPCNATSPLYNTVSASTVTIDGVQFTTTGRRGEKLSF